MGQQAGKSKGNQTTQIKFAMCVDFIDEVQLDVVSLDVCGVVFESRGI